MNDWVARENPEVKSIETLEMQWPETTLFHVRHNAWFGTTQYKVRFIRVWYRTFRHQPHCYVPQYEIRYTRGGETAEPFEFPVHPLPDVNKTFGKQGVATKRADLTQKEQLKLMRGLPAGDGAYTDYFLTAFVFALLASIVVALFVPIK